MNAEGEILNASLLATQVENANLGVGDTTVETRFGVRLILTVAVAASRTTTHLENKFQVASEIEKLTRQMKMDRKL